MNVIQEQYLDVASQLQQVVREVPGWCSHEQMLALFSLAVASAGLKGDIVEIGSWCGRTAIAMGLAARRTEGTRLHCIDLFPRRQDWHENSDGTYSFSVVTDEGPISVYRQHSLWREPFERDVLPLYEKHDSSLDVLMEAVRNYGLADCVSVHRGTSAVLRTRLPSDFRCRLAFIDGDHSFEAVCSDITNVEASLVAGGWLCFDDAFTCYPGVDRAIETLILNNPRYDLQFKLTRKLFVARRAPGT